jgi:hypothetical protein
MRGSNSENLVIDEGVKRLCEQCGGNFPPKWSDAREPMRFCERRCERRHGVAHGLIKPRRKPFQGLKLTANDQDFLRACGVKVD